MDTGNAPLGDNSRTVDERTAAMLRQLGRAGQDIADALRGVDERLQRSMEAMYQRTANLETAIAYYKLQPHVRELVRALPRVPVRRIVEDVLALCAEDTQRQWEAAGGFIPAKEYPAQLVDIEAEALAPAQRREKPGPKPLETGELLEIWRDFQKSGISKNAFCDLRHMSKHTLGRAAKEAQRLGLATFSDN